MATEEDAVGTGAIGTMVAVLALAVVVIGLAVTALVRTEQSDLNATRETGANLRPIRELRAAHLAELTAGPAFIDKAQGVVSVPIDRAMELVVGEARTRQQAGLNVPTAPIDAGTTAPSASVEPAAPAPAALGAGAPPATDAVAPETAKPDTAKAETSAAPTLADKPAAPKKEVAAPPSPQGHAP